MEKYKEIVLGAKALEYIRYCLTNGLTLSEYLLKNIDLETGQVVTALPENANLAKIDNFEEGWIIPQPPKSEGHRYVHKDGTSSILVPVNTFTSYLLDTIHTFLEASPERICLLENAAFGPNAPCMQRRKSHIIIFRDEFYHFLTSGKHSRDDIKVAIRDAKTAWHLIGAMTSLPDDKFTLSDGQEITSDILRILAARTEKIFVSAYDGEAYLIWHRGAGNLIEDLEKNPKNWEKISEISKPAMGKKYKGGKSVKETFEYKETGEATMKKRMNERPILNRLEHNLLSMQVDDEEPLFVLYRDTMRDIEGANLDLIVQSLVKLARMGFIKCYFITNGHLHVKSERKPIAEPTVDELKRYASAYSEEDLRYYPSHGDYYFQITEKGETEEAKDIYDIYYPESEE